MRQRESDYFNSQIFTAIIVNPYVKECWSPFLEGLILPHTKPGGVTFAICQDSECAGGGAIVAVRKSCCACHGFIKVGPLAFR